MIYPELKHDLTVEPPPIGLPVVFRDRAYRLRRGYVEDPKIRPSFPAGIFAIRHTDAENRTIYTHCYWHNEIKDGNIPPRAALVAAPDWRAINRRAEQAAAALAAAKAMAVATPDAYRLNRDQMNILRTYCLAKARTGGEVAEFCAARFGVVYTEQWARVLIAKLCPKHSLGLSLAASELDQKGAA